MPRFRTLADRLNRAAQAVEAARVHTAGPMPAREDLRLAVRELADALENVAMTVRLLHQEVWSEPDVPATPLQPPLSPGNP